MLRRPLRQLRRVRFSSTGPVKEATPLVEPAEPQWELLLKDKDAKIAELQDLYRRALADAENVRTRTRRELVDKEHFAIQKFAKGLLDTADVLQMALDSVKHEDREQTKPLADFYDGVLMTRTELLKTFKRFGVEPFVSLDRPFDPNMHTALFKAPAAGKEPGTVFHVQKDGYMINDRVLRSAHVGVVNDN